MIRTTTMEESTQVWGACMNDSGFPVALDAAGGMSWSAATEAQQKDYETAMYLCVAQYPWDPKAYQPWNDAQLRALHAHQTGEVTDCLTRLGHPPPEPPTLEKFSADYRNNVSPRWHPYHGIPSPTTRPASALASSARS
ncbi:hypothetical protein [Ornithinimicrobium panacihumi]|uniref:hypothetical protein n=1 Tax=Ornithinimicrobium panacihumi TaxID=2008449 RepID=UPI003F8A3219